MLSRVFALRVLAGVGGVELGAAVGDALLQGLDAQLQLLEGLHAACARIGVEEIAVDADLSGADPLQLAAHHQEFALAQALCGVTDRPPLRAPSAPARTWARVGWMQRRRSLKARLRERNRPAT
jgi:hypothetical protein